MTDLLTATGLTLRFGAGVAELDPNTGSPVRFIADDAPDRRYLLHDGLKWHSDEHRWGSGHVITDRGAARWATPTTVQQHEGAVLAGFDDVLDGLRIEVERTGGDRLTERYRFTNTGRDPVTLTSVGIQTPFADLYENAQAAIEQSVHAHLFTGGTWAWVLAQPMSGTGPHLGLIVRDGAVHGYSVESRNANTLSNARGHLVLQLTDQARNPTAFGGQPAIRLAPGATHMLTWELGWYDDISAFLTDTAPPAVFDRFSAPVGTPIRVQARDAPVIDDDAVRVDPDPSGWTIHAARPGMYPIRVGGGRTAVQFHDPVQATVRRRAEYILRYQRAGERAGVRRYALLPVDTRYRLAQPTSGWQDWTDGAERIGMAVLLQVARSRGWIGPDADDALDGWARFARAELLDDSFAPRRGSSDPLGIGPRLYDAPWLAEFFLERHHHLTRTRGDGTEELLVAERVLRRAFELGAERFLAIGFSETVVAVADALEHTGSAEAAARLRQQLVTSARYFLDQGDRLPPHEVAYEQSIVAPLVSLLTDAHHLTGDPVFLTAIADRLPWLLAFGGPQPHARLHGIAIRHWDGYWFGIDRQWGDVFPHYWSALTASALLRLPPQLRTPEQDRLAGQILAANLANFFPDGSATCAFVMPTTVDGRAAHSPDPLANDQDWHLVIWCRLAAAGLAPVE
jgi:hypothetical protein